MRLQLSELSARGLHIKDTISLEALNDRMNEAPGNDIFFTTAPQVEITVMPNRGGAQITGTVKSRCKQPCSFCAKEIEREIEVPLDLMLKPQPEDSLSEEEDEIALDDVGIVYYQDENIDLEELLQESLILTLSPYWKPDADERGCCGVCGVNFEEAMGGEKEKGSGQTLAQLLKKAGL